MYWRTQLLRRLRVRGHRSTSRINYSLRIRVRIRVRIHVRVRVRVRVRTCMRMRGDVMCTVARVYDAFMFARAYCKRLRVCVRRCASALCVCVRVCVSMHA